MRVVSRKLRLDELEQRLMLTITVLEGQVEPPAGFFGPAEVLINFDELPNGDALAQGTAIAQQYESLGIEFTAISGPDSRFLQAGFGSNTDFVSAPNSLAAGHLDPSDNEAVEVEVNFIDANLTELPTEVGFVFTDSAPNNPFTVRFYDADDNLVDSVTINTADDSGAGTVTEDTFIGIKDAGEISRFTYGTEFDHANNIFGMEIDDVRFSPGPVQCAIACMHVSDSSGNLATVDVSTGETQIIGQMNQVMFDIAFAPSGELYGVTGNSLYLINEETAATTFIGNHGIPTANALTFSDDGRLCAMSASETLLYEIDVTTGASFSLGNVGFSSAGDLAFVDDVLYLASTTDQLVRVNLSPSVSGTVIGNFGVTDVLGLAAVDNDTLYATAATQVYLVDLLSGAAEDPVEYGGQGLQTAVGAAFIDPNGNGALSGFKFNDENANGVRDESLLQGSPPHVVFTVDMSFRVNENLGGTAVGDVNNDGIADSRLDAELAGFLALNQELVDEGFASTAQVSIVTFNAISASFDMDTVTAGKQLATSPTADMDGNGVRDVEELLRSIGRSNVTSNISAGLQESLSVLNAVGAIGSNGNVVLTSNGGANAGGAIDSVADSIRDRGSKLRVIGLGDNVDLDLLQMADPNTAAFETTDDFLGVLSGLVAPTFDFQEPGLPGWTIYVDTNANGLLDSSEPSTVTDATGAYSFPDLFAGSYIVREVNQPGWLQTFPSPTSDLLGGIMVDLGAGDAQTGIDFGNKRLFTGPEISVQGRGQQITDGSTTASVDDGTDFSTLLDRDPASAPITYVMTAMTICNSRTCPFRVVS